MGATTTLRRLGVALPLLLAAAGCNRQTANTANLKRGLNHYLHQVEPCAGYTAASFPITTFAGSPRVDLEALAAAGLVSRQSVINGARPQLRYDLTDMGRRTTFRGQPAQRGAANVFCFGQLEVDTIRYFTEPVETGGLHVTLVTYTRKLTHQPAWTQDAAVRRAFPGYSGSETLPQTSGMILTNQGWRLPNDENP